MKITVEARDINGIKCNPTAIELATALTFTHRLINKAYSENSEDRTVRQFGKSSINSEAALVNFQVAEVTNGSVILDGLIKIINNLSPQAISENVVANIITSGIVAVVKKSLQPFRRLPDASMGRDLIVRVEINDMKLEVHSSYRNLDRADISVNVSYSNKE